MKLKSIHLRKRKQTKKGKISLYLEYYYGMKVNTDGKKSPIREYEYLDMYLLSKKKKTVTEKQQDEETLRLAESIRAKRLLEHQNESHGFKNKTKRNTQLLAYYEAMMEKRKNSNGNYGNWYGAFLHLKKFLHRAPDLQFKELDVSFLEDFKEYLLTQAKTKSGKLLAKNSAHSYFNKLRAVLNQAYEDNYLENNLTKKVERIKAENPIREYLTEEELKNLAKTKCDYEVLKRAFLFGCMSGLRWSDIQKLTWGEIRDDDENEKYKVLFRQQKTQKAEYHPISKNARSLLGKKGENDERVFIGLKYSGWHNRALQIWVLKAGIDKDITFHCSRHTYAIILLMKGVSLFTVSKMLGHADIKTTQIYAQIVDKEKEKAAEQIPEIDIDFG